MSRFKLVAAFLTKDNSPKLEKMFFRLTKENALNSNAWVYYAHALTYQNKRNKAIDAYRKAIKININNSSAWEGLSIILRSQKSWNKANDLFPVELEESISSKINKKIIAYFFGEDESDRIINTFNQKKNFNVTKNIDVYGLTESNKMNEDVEFHLKVVKLNPDSAWAWKSLGHILKKKHRIKDALAVYLQATKLAPHEQSLFFADNAWRYLINTLIEVGKIKEAVNTSQEALNLNPHKIWAWNNLGDALFKQKSYEQAEIIYRDALIKFPNNLNLLKSDLKLALAQKDKIRFQQHLKLIQPILNQDDPYYNQLVFLVFLVDLKSNYQPVLNAIKNSSNQSISDWSFTDIDFIIQPNDNKKRQQAELFINYFKGESDLNFLIQELII